MRHITTEILNTLAQSGDWQHRDFIGFDPFHLRDVRNVLKQDVGDIDSVIQRYNLTGQTLPPVNKVAAGYCPELVHLIWLGPADITKRSINCVTFHEIILSWQRHCKEKQIILWTNQFDGFKNKIDRATLIEFCLKYNIALIDADNLVDNIMSRDLNKVYRHEILSPNYGGASDVLRLSLLQLFGGIYADIDIEITAPIQSVFLKHGIALNCLNDELESDIASEDEKNAAVIMNNFFLSLPGCEHLQRLVNQLIAFYSKSLSSFKSTFRFKVEEFLSDCKNHPELSYNDLPKRSFRTETTIYLTGPALWSQVFGDDRREIIQNYDADIVFSLELACRHAIIKSPVHMNHSAKTWIANDEKNDFFVIRTPAQLQSHEQIDTLQRTLTHLLFNLQLEPRVLLQNMYRSVFYDHELAFIIYQLLFTHYAKMLSNLEFVGPCSSTTANPYQLYKTGKYHKQLSAATAVKYPISPTPNLLQLVIDGQQTAIAALIQLNPCLVDFEYTAFDAQGRKITSTPFIYASSRLGVRISNLIKSALDNENATLQLAKVHPYDCHILLYAYECVLNLINSFLQKRYEVVYHLRSSEMEQLNTGIAHIIKLQGLIPTFLIHEIFYFFHHREIYDLRKQTIPTLTLMNDHYDLFCARKQRKFGIDFGFSGLENDELDGKDYPLPKLLKPFSEKNGDVQLEQLEIILKQDSSTIRTVMTALMNHQKTHPLTLPNDKLAVKKFAALHRFSTLNQLKQTFFARNLVDKTRVDPYGAGALARRC